MPGISVALKRALSTFKDVLTDGNSEHSCSSMSGQECRGRLVRMYYSSILS